MDATITRILSSVTLGPPAVHHGATLLPVFIKPDSDMVYRALGDALASRDLEITELDDSGSVSQVLASNSGDSHVVAIGGELLAGARQDRVITTAIHLSPGEKRVLPVACVEAGRWEALTSHLVDSGLFIDSGLRALIAATVTANLARGRGFTADQKRVWAHADALLRRARAHSSTGALKEAYRRLNVHLDELVPQHDHQSGLMCVRAGVVIGVVAMSCRTAYASIHAATVAAMLTGVRLHDSEDQEARERDLTAAKQFIVELADARVSRHRFARDAVSHRISAASCHGEVLEVDGSLLAISLHSLDSCLPSTVTTTAVFTSPV